MKPLNSIRFSMVSAICRLEIKPSLVRKMSLSSFFLMLYIPFSLLRRTLVLFGTGYSIDFLTALEVCCTHFLQIPADQVISGLFQKIITAFQKGTSFSYTYSNLCLTALLLHCIEISGKKLCYYSQSQHTGQNEYISFTIKYIQQNYTSKIQIKDISDKLGISSRYLSKIFLDHMGMTLLNYINTYRMNQAIRLIADTDMTMTEIADHIGMNDSQHFSKLFKNTIGSTPCEYRKFLKK